MKKAAGVLASAIVLCVGGLFAGWFSLASPAFGADAGRIGIVDFQRILTDSDAGKAIQARIREEGRYMEAELMKAGETIESLMQQLERDSMVMSPESREKQQRELETRRREFHSMRQKYQSEFREIEIDLVEKLREDVFAIAESIGKREGYLLIIEKSAAVYYPGTIDITDRIIQAYNERFDGTL